MSASLEHHVDEVLKPFDDLQVPRVTSFEGELTIPKFLRGLKP